MASLGSPRYVRFTNFRRNGDPVGTPVWFAPMGREWVFSTGPTAGKVKRLRNNPAVEITACDVRGRVAGGTETFSGTARLLDADDHSAAEKVLAAKYGIQWTMIGLGDRLRRLIGRPAESAYIAVRLDEA